MYLKRLEVAGFKSFAEKRELLFTAPVTAIVGPNGSGKSNIAEAFRFVLGEQSMKSMRTKRGEDLIFNGSRMAGRKNRALVTVTFDNKDRIFPVDYEEVVLSREVMRDGTNRYLINGTQVRLKDVMELLASARIGSSQHHIISQGEADKILSSSSEERRAMIEDALGLKIYQFKITESAKKLRKTEENIGQVESLQKEIEPHLKFLEKQVKRIEEVRELRGELVGQAKNYFAKEEAYITQSEKCAREKKEAEEAGIAGLDAEIQKLKGTMKEEEASEDHGKVLELEEKIGEIRKEKDENTRALGRIEGMISLEEKQLELNRKRQEEGGTPSVIPYERASDFAFDIKRKVDAVEGVVEVPELSRALFGIKRAVREFLNSHKNKQDGTEPQIDTSELERLKQERERLEKEAQNLESREKEQREAQTQLKNEMENERGRFRQAERELFEKMAERSEFFARFQHAERTLNEILREKETFESDLSDFSFLLGREILRYEKLASNDNDTDLMLESARSAQREERRNLERKKVKVEEMGGSGEEVVSEYENLKERKDFLEREVKDLEESKASLEKLIVDLENQLDADFKNGLSDINRQFQEFFELMFGGGKVSLELEKKQKKQQEQKTEETAGPDLNMENTEEEKEGKRGLEIAVSLPQKRIKGVQMLSGGERSLTSIALLFAVSQVNPPPFLVLDETDAALDEANSKRYGEMLENLAKKTQLIIITHNRETMSRADILYGVTVGKDAVSKVLSVKFEDAEKNAAR